jgi:hypothetical protein
MPFTSKLLVSRRIVRFPIVIAALVTVQCSSGSPTAPSGNAGPPPGEERAQYLGTLAWYGVAPPSPEADRVWVGPRVLVREGETEGFVKVVIERGTEKLLGATVCCAHGGDLLASLTIPLHVEGGSLEAVLATTFAHPTLSETVKVAVRNAISELRHPPP